MVKPKCKLVGADSNVYTLIGLVRGALKAAGLLDREKEFTNRVLSCGSYDEALGLMTEYVEVL